MKSKKDFHLFKVVFLFSVIMILPSCSSSVNKTLHDRTRIKIRERHALLA